MSTAIEIINKFNLQPHPEGGYYKEIYRAPLNVDCTHTHGGTRSAYTTIYFLLSGKDFSTWHKVASDETWLFHAGSNVAMYSIEKNGTIKKQILGTDNFQLTIPAHTWFAAELNDNTHEDSYCLVSCIVAPGFDFKDFELADSKKFLQTFGESAEKINLLGKFLR